MNTLIEDKAYEALYENWKFKTDRLVIKMLLLFGILLLAAPVYGYMKTEDMGIAAAMMVMPGVMLLVVLFLNVFLKTTIKKGKHKIEGIDPYVNFETSGMKVPFYTKLVMNSEVGQRAILVDFIMNFEDGKVSLIGYDDEYEVIGAHDLQEATFQFFKKKNTFKKTLIIQTGDMVSRVMLIEALVPKLFEYVKNQGYTYVEFD